jgi:hypothetical protein
MLKRTLMAALAALGTLAFAASAQAAYLGLGTTNTSNATTTLSGNTSGSELLVKNTNGSSAGAFAFGLYGLLTATSPTVTATAVRGLNNSTNARGYGLWGSQAGSGTGRLRFRAQRQGRMGQHLGRNRRARLQLEQGLRRVRLEPGRKGGLRHQHERKRPLRRELER